MRFIRTIIFFILFVFVESTWYNSEHRICDATGESWVPFTGFKIHRKYVVKNLKPPMLHFVSLSQCDRGELVYERLLRTGRETDIEWDKPFCFFQEASFNITQNNETQNHGSELKISSNDKSNKMDKQKELLNGNRTRSFNPLHKQIEKQMNKVKSKSKDPKKLNIDEVPKKPHAIPKSEIHSPNRLDKRNNNEKAHHKQTFNSLIRKISSKAKFIEYKQDPLETDLEDLDPLTYDNTAIQNLDNLKCYKLARRKKYTQRQAMVYSPYTWVGGLFECDIDVGTKQKYVQSLIDSRDFIKPFEFKCHASDSTPLFPLIADDVTNQWIEKDKGFTFAQRIPYLCTPGIFDVRYGKSAQTLGVKFGQTLFEGHDIAKKVHDSIPVDKWFNEIEINENYEYTKDDLSILSSTTRSTKNLFDQFLQSDKRFLQPWEWDLKDLVANDNDNIGYLEHKFLSLMGRIKDKHTIDSFLVDIQEQWDNLTLSKEVFNYRK